MRILVTGGTGFVGSHTVRALLADGHDVRLLVRDPAKLERVFGSGAGADVVQGDVADEAAVERALDGVEAVVHAAAIVALEAARAREVEAVNLRAVELVVGGAVRRGLGPVVHVSSAAALYRPNARVLIPDGPIGEARTAYGRSKAEAELRVRELQERGAPVVTTYPTAVIGPDDPGLSEGNHALLVFLRDLFIDTSSGFQTVDVRDVAEVHRAIFSQARGPDRFMVAGSYLPWRELGDELAELTGRLRRLPVPGALLRGAGRVCDVIKRVFPFDFPLTREGSVLATRWVPADATRTSEALGLSFRPVRPSLVDTIQWLVDAGHLHRKRAGRLVSEAGGVDAGT